MTGKAYNNRCIAEWLHNVTQRHWRHSSDPRAPLAHLLMSLYYIIFILFLFYKVLFPVCCPGIIYGMLFFFQWCDVCHGLFWDSPIKEWYHSIFRNYGTMSSLFVAGIALFELYAHACVCMYNIWSVYVWNIFMSALSCFFLLLYCPGPHNRRQLLTRLAWHTLMLISNLLGCLFWSSAAICNWLIFMFENMAPCIWSVYLFLRHMVALMMYRVSFAQDGEGTFHLTSEVAWASVANGIYRYICSVSAREWSFWFTIHVHACACPT